MDISRLTNTATATPTTQISSSSGESLQYRYSAAGGVIRLATAWMIRPERAAMGM